MGERGKEKEEERSERVGEKTRAREYGRIRKGERRKERDGEKQRIAKDRDGKRSRSCRREEWGVRVTPGKPKQTGLLCVGAYEARRSVACGEGRTLTLRRTHRCLTHENRGAYGVAGEKSTGLLWALRVVAAAAAAMPPKTTTAAMAAVAVAASGDDAVIEGRRFQNMAA